MQPNLNNTPSRGPLTAEDFDRDEPADGYDMTWFYGAVLLGLCAWGLLALWGVAA